MSWLLRWLGGAQGEESVRFWTQLEAKNVDLVCGSIPTTPGPDPALDPYDVIEWQREDLALALVTNLQVRELPVDSVTQDQLPAIPLLAPAAGLIADFLRRRYGHDFRTRLQITAEIDSIYYGMALLRSRLVHGALISTSAAAHAAVEGRLPGGPGLRLIPLVPRASAPRSRSSQASSPARANAPSTAQSTPSTCCGNGTSGPRMPSRCWLPASATICRRCLPRLPLPVSARELLSR